MVKQGVENFKRQMRLAHAARDRAALVPVKRRPKGNAFSPTNINYSMARQFAKNAEDRLHEAITAQAAIDNRRRRSVRQRRAMY